MSRQLEFKGRKFWILSEPHGGPGWKATVLEAKGGGQEAVGIDATAQTRGAADDAAERKLRRMLGLELSGDERPAGDADEAGPSSFVRRRSTKSPQSPRSTPSPQKQNPK